MEIIYYSDIHVNDTVYFYTRTNQAPYTVLKIDRSGIIIENTRTGFSYFMPFNYFKPLLSNKYVTVFRTKKGNYNADF